MDETSPSCCSSRSCCKFLPIIVALVLGGFFVAGKYVEVRGVDRPSISVDAEGKVMAQPDIAQLAFGVQTGRVQTAQGAMESLTTKMNKVVEAIKAAGVEEKDISTQALWLNPAYDYTDGKRVDRGFEAGQNLQVKVRDLEKIGSVLNVAVSDGANQVGSVSFTIDDPEELRAQAREMAITKAKAKAATLAAQLGKSLGKLRAFNEGYVGYPVNYDRVNMKLETSGMGGGAEAPMPVLPAGEQEVSVTVTLTYDLK